MNTVGKILVILNFVFALVVGGFLAIDFATRTNWHKAYKALETEVKTQNASRGSSQEVAGAVVAKTGTLIQIPVSNLTGMASTAEGAFYFGIFFQMKDLKDQNHGQLPKTREAASSMVDVIVAKYGNKNSQPLAKQAEIFLPFDAALK